MTEVAGFSPVPAAVTPPTASPPVSSDPTVHFRPPHSTEIGPVVAALLSLPGRPADPGQVNEFLRNAEVRKIDLSLLRLAERRGRLLFSLLPVLSPGRTALLLASPAPSAASEMAAAAELIERLCIELRERGILLAQSLLEPTDAAARSLFTSQHFAVMSELIYVSGEPRRKQTAPPLPPGMQWLTYSESVHDLFRQTISASYEQSLDCPGLNGIREMEDVIAGHRAAGEFDPSLWRLLCRTNASGINPTPLGVLLLSTIPLADAIELVYLGVSPAARGQGLGDLMVKQGLATVAERKLSRLTLAVDSQNSPALQIYYKNGLVRVGRKVAMMRQLLSRGS
jgi:ribosomal protein S18 acetylase RimI-like enzyme